MKGPDELIRVENLSYAYGDFKVLDDLTFSVYRGEALVIMGQSGCGKTTLLKILIGLLKPGQGKVVILGHDLSVLDEDALDEFRERIGMLFQFGALVNSLTVGENVLLTLERRMGLDRKVAEKVARLKLAMVGLPFVFDLYPSELSGGMKKRAGLARAMLLDPELLFFDEPTSGLDPNTAAGLDELILELKQLLKTTMVVVTHDLESAFSMGDRIVMLHEGRIVATGTAEELRALNAPEVDHFLNRRAPEKRTEVDQRLASLFKENS